MYKKVNMVVDGRVQGVSYRSSTRRKANELGVNGWVKNRSDGTVEIVAEGKKEYLERLIEWCQEGPPAAQVTDIDVEWEEHEDRFEGFNVKL